MIDPATEPGAVRLTVRDLARSRSFYEEKLGMHASERSDGTLAVGASDGESLLILTGDGSAIPRDPSLTGLFHLAVLLPSRQDLALALLRLARARWPLTGASDHLVSEALYLNDPDGNGIEIYRDRPRSEWTHDEQGQVEMATLPLDLESVAAELRARVPPEGEEPPIPPGTRIGHVHLQVAELRDSAWFYEGILGFDVTVRTYPGALFLSAGGYHHHIGLNTWNSRGAAAPPAGSVGLRCFEVRLPDEDALADVIDRVQAAELPIEPTERGALLSDPSGNGVLLSARLP